MGLTGAGWPGRDPVLAFLKFHSLMLRKLLMRLPWPGRAPPRPVRTAARLFQHGGSPENTVTTEQKRSASPYPVMAGLDPAIRSGKSLRQMADRDEWVAINKK
jgi:hypothetical protein